MRESLAAGKRARSFAAKEHKPRSRDRGWRKGHTESRDNATGSDYIDVSPRFNVRGIVLLFSPHHASLSSLLSSLFLLSATAASVCAYKAGIVGATLWLRVFPPLSSLLSFRHRRIPLSRVPPLSLSLSPTHTSGYFTLVAYREPRFCRSDYAERRLNGMAERYTRAKCLCLGGELERGRCCSEWTDCRRTPARETGWIVF